MANSLALFHPLIRDWFEGRFGVPTLVQQAAWPRIANAENLLITAPTGSGKTLTAFLMATCAWHDAGAVYQPAEGAEQRY
jgi:Lhr-like helicase